VHAADSIRASVRAVRACNYEGPRIATFITAADTDADAQRLFTSVQQMTLSRLRGTLLPFLPEPVADFDALANAEERQRTDAAARAAINGSAQSLETQLMAMLEKPAQTKSWRYRSSTTSMRDGARWKSLRRRESVFMRGSARSGAIRARRIALD